MTREDVESMDVLAGSPTSPYDLLVLAGWPVVGAIRAHNEMKSGGSRIAASRRYAAMLTIWLVGASLSIGSALAL